MKIYVVGNILVEKDSLQLKILPELIKTFPEIEFIEIDPNENFTPLQNEPLYIIDTVEGIKKTTVFSDLELFLKHRLISPHDYDLLFHLQLLKKLNRLPKRLFMIGIPKEINYSQAICSVKSIIQKQLSS